MKEKCEERKTASRCYTFNRANWLDISFDTFVFIAQFNICAILIPFVLQASHRTRKFHATHLHRQLRTAIDSPVSCVFHLNRNNNNAKRWKSRINFCDIKIDDAKSLRQWKSNICKCAQTMRRKRHCEPWCSHLLTAIDAKLFRLEYTCNVESRQHEIYIWFLIFALWFV